MLAVHAQPIRAMSAMATADAISQAGQIFHYLPAPSIGATPGQPKNWPTVWSTDAEFDLMSRLATLPAFSPHGAQGAQGGNGLGDVASDIQAIIQKGPEILQKAVQIINQAGPQLDTILAVVQDPAFAQIVERVKTLQALTAAEATTPAAFGATDTGIAKLVPILDAAIFVESHPTAKFALEHPILVGAGIAVLAIGLGVGAGVAVGRWSKKCKTAAVGRRYRRRA